MTTTLISTTTTILWIVIETIQFAYMAYLMWRDRHDVNNRNLQRARTAFACA